jgi:hypothetical protein
VSKEIYYDIAMDLKEIFQTTKDISEKEEDTLWNEDCGGEKKEAIREGAALMSGPVQPSGFTFSFFESDTKDVKEGTFLFSSHLYFRQIELDCTLSVMDLLLSE